MSAFAIGGGIASGIGSLIGGASQNRAGRQARDWYDKRTGEGMGRLYQLLYGPGAGNPLSRSYTPGTNPTDYSILGKLAGLAKYGKDQGGQIQGQYDAGTSRLAGLAGGAEAMARDWGKGREGIIRADSKDRLTNTNRQADAVLAGSGFNAPTVRASQRAGAAAAIGRETDRSLQDLAEAQIDRQLGARTQNLTVQGGREAGRTGLMTNLLSQDLALQRAPIDVQLNAASSSIANPWLGQNTTSYYPGANGAASALTNLGGMATSYGGYQMGQDNLAKLLEALKK